MKARKGMRISTKGRYGVWILIDVAQNGGSSPVRLADISARQGISVKYTEQITGLLVKCGLLKSVRGAQGGYELFKNPSEITVGEILRKTEGDISLVDCTPDSHCPHGEGCTTRKLWQGLNHCINEYLDGITLQDLVDMAPDGSDYYNI